MPRVLVVPMKTPSQMNAAKPQTGISTVGGGSHDVRLVGEQSEKARAAHGIDERVGGGERCAPGEEAAHRATELLVVARAVVFAAERLAGKGETVHHV